MDPRIDIHRIFQLNPGDVFVLRNAGNIYTQDMMRSLIIAIFKYKIKFIVILGHLDCGMKNINPKELREKLPNEFLKGLSINYSDLLLELRTFFKPFDNEIRNIIEQINKLHKIKAFFPDIEITGMLYDTQSGWIFKAEDFRDFLIDKNHLKIYKGLLYEKNLQLSKFLEENYSAEASIDLTDENLVEELELKEEDKSLLMEEPEFTDVRDEEHQKSIDNEDTSFQVKIPKIQIPKIFIPKIKIHIPKTNRDKGD